MASSARQARELLVGPKWSALGEVLYDTTCALCPEFDNDRVHGARVTRQIIGSGIVRVALSVGAQWPAPDVVRYHMSYSEVSKDLDLSAYQGYPDVKEWLNAGRSSKSVGGFSVKTFFFFREDLLDEQRNIWDMAYSARHRLATVSPRGRIISHYPGWLRLSSKPKLVTTARMGRGVHGEDLPSSQEIAVTEPRAFARIARSVGRLDTPLVAPFARALGGIIDIANMSGAVRSSVASGEKSLPAPRGRV